MELEDVQVTLLFSRVLAVARAARDVCPSVGHTCWRHRNLGAYLPGDRRDPKVLAQNECVECWLHFIMAGD